MSGILMTPCWNLALGTTHKIVLLSLADNASDEGFCFPHVATIMRRTSLSRPTVFRALQWLEEQGYIRRLSGAIEGKGNKYIVDPTGNAAAERDRERDFLGVARKRTPSHSDTPPSHSDTPPVSHRDPSEGAPIEEVLNNQLTIKEHKPRTPQESVAKPDGVTDGTWQDWCAHRRRKKATITAGIIATARELADEWGWTLEKYLKAWVLHGTQGFHPSWVERKQNGGQQNNSGYKSVWQRREEEAQKWIKPKPKTPHGVIIDVTPANREQFTLLEKTQ